MKRKWVVPLVIYATAYLDIDGLLSSKDAVRVEVRDAVKIGSINDRVKIELDDVGAYDPFTEVES